MANRSAIIDELNARNAMRIEACLPLIDVDTEADKLEMQADQEIETKAFEQWKAGNPEIVAAIRQEVLENLRSDWNKPDDWKPTGMLSGGGMWYETSVRVALLKKFRGE